MPFSAEVKQQALLNSRRCCCICQEFIGRLTNVHHIVQEADGGSDDLENAIVLCLKCHGEVGHYNAHHPIGNKYSVDEVRKHRDYWWDWCANNPASPIPKSPISVSPNKIALVSGEWKTKGVLTVHNKTNAVYYDVWIKLGCDLLNVALSEISILDIDVPHNMVSQIGNAEIVGDISLFGGTDSEGRTVIFLLLRNIAPLAVCTFSITISTSLRANIEYKADIVATVEGFLDQPERQVIHKGDTEIAMSVLLPEPITITHQCIRFGKTNIPPKSNRPTTGGAQSILWDTTNLNIPPTTI